MIPVWQESLWPASLRGGIALLAAWLFCQIPRIPATVQCWALRAGYAVLLICLLWRSPVNLPLLRPLAIAAAPTAATSGAAIPQIRLNTDRPQTVKITSSSRSIAIEKSQKPYWPEIAMAAWLAFLIAYSARLAISALRTWQLRSGCRLQVPDLIELCRDMKVARTPLVVTHSAATTPMLLGIWRPMIVLPVSMTGPKQLRLIIAHELAHLKRKDLIWNWLPTLAKAAAPFHPCVWLCLRRWRLAAEAACDAQVLSATAADSAQYARVLVKVATARPRLISGAFAIAAGAGSTWLLKRRLAQMAHPTQWNRRSMAVTGIGLMAIAILIAIPWRVVAQQSPHTESGGPAASEVRLPATAPASPKAKDLGATAIGQIVIPQADLRSLTSGAVAAVKCEDGQAVKKGDILVELDARDREQAVATAAEILKIREEQFELTVEMHKAATVSQEALSEARLQVDEAKDTYVQRQAALQQCRIAAPFDGVVFSVRASVGSTVMPGDPIASVMAAGLATVKFAVTPEQARGLKPGTGVEVSDRSGKLTCRGKVTSIGPDVDPSTGTMQVKAQLDSTGQSLASGEFVNVKFAAEQ